MRHIGIECESIEDGQYWGVGRIVFQLLEHIAEHPELESQFRIHLYFKKRIPDLAFLQQPIFISTVVTPHFLPASFSLYYYILLPIRVMFERIECMYFPNYMLPILYFGKSMVMLTEDVYSEARNPQLPFRYRLAYRIFPTWAAKQATRIETITHASKKAVGNLFDIEPSRIVVNPLGIDIQQSGMHYEKEDLLLYVGQAFPRRHARETILAFAKIAEEFPHHTLAVIGADKYTPPILTKLAEEINKKLGSERIIYKDYVPEEELIALYSKAQSLIYVSPKEAFGLPPVEALHYHTAPIVCRTEVTEEIFEGNAFYVENPESIEEIAQVMKESMRNQQKRSSIFAHAPHILERYTWKQHMERFIQQIKEIIHA
jgi:glycosyltransferase involved in cell wall biosynthesis